MLPTKICTGCKACGEICSIKCISFENNNEGFWYPQIDAGKCVHCGHCEQVCPVLHAADWNQAEALPEAIAAWSRNRDTRAASSSGGIFGELAAAVITENGVVCGAAADPNLSVKHVIAESLSELEQLRGSKYVQSDVEDCYCIVQQYLKSERAVLFSGTPCQVAGLKSYLGHDYENLITVDIICHGVPSPLVWEQYLAHHKKTFQAKPQKASFRDKTDGWTNFSMAMQFEDGREYRRSLKDDAYMKAFLQNLCLRESCYKCSFKSIRRVSDLTIGDFWGVDKVLPGINDDQGISLVLLQSEKGREIFQKIQSKVSAKAVDCLAAVDLNGAAEHSVYRHPFRDYFFLKLPNSNFEKLVQDCLSPNYLVRLERKLRSR